MRAFNAAGQDAHLVASRKRLPRVEAIVFLAVPDGAVTAVATEMVRSAMPPETSFVHCSGALGLDALAPLAGHAVGSFHPLQSFPGPRPPEAFTGITIAVDASSTGLERRLAQLARELGAKPRHVGDEQRVLYHAAAVFASNYVVVVVEQAVSLLMSAGWSRAAAEEAVLPLVEGVAGNMRSAGVAKALTGPIRRGDSETVKRHIEALHGLRAHSAGIAVSSPLRGEETYRMLGLVALEIAKQAGLEPAAAERTKRALTRNVAATRRRGRS